MDAARFKKLHPKEYLRKFLDAGIRPDGRRPMAIRKVVASRGAISSADGSALVKVGPTTAVCGVKLEIGQPSALTPRRGRIEIAVSMSAGCSAVQSKRASSMGTYAATDSKQMDAMARTIEECIESVGMVELEQLCVKEGDAVWVLKLDVVCLDYAGNVFDAALFAATAALSDVRLPDARVLDDGQVVVVKGGAVERLRIRGYPLVPVTFGLVDSKLLVADPSADEEPGLRGTLSLVCAADGRVCRVQKRGGVAIPMSRLQECGRIVRGQLGRLKQSLSLDGT